MLGTNEKTVFARVHSYKETTASHMEFFTSESSVGGYFFKPVGGIKRVHT